MVVEWELGLELDLQLGLEARDSCGSYGKGPYGSTSHLEVRDSR